MSLSGNDRIVLNNIWQEKMVRKITLGLEMERNSG